MSLVTVWIICRLIHSEWEKLSSGFALNLKSSWQVKQRRSSRIIMNRREQAIGGEQRKHSRGGYGTQSTVFFAYSSFLESTCAWQPRNQDPKVAKATVNICKSSDTDHWKKKGRKHLHRMVDESSDLKRWRPNLCAGVFLTQLDALSLKSLVGWLTIF